MDPKAEPELALRAESLDQKPEFSRKDEALEIYPESSDLTGVMWNDKAWLACFPLNDETALDYFSLSQFYDASSNNELVKMQRLHSSVVEKLTGIEYALVHSKNNSLFIIEKRNRLSESRVETLAVYYIVDGNIYQCPTAHSVISSRILHSLQNLRRSFEEIQSHAKFESSGKYTWVPPPPAVVLDDITFKRTFQRDGQMAGRADVVAQNFEQKSVDKILYDVIAKNRAELERIQARSSSPSIHYDSSGALGGGVLGGGAGNSGGGGGVGGDGGSVGSGGGGMVPSSNPKLQGELGKLENNDMLKSSDAMQLS